MIGIIQISTFDDVLVVRDFAAECRDVVFRLGKFGSNVHVVVVSDPASTPILKKLHSVA
jgi:hypothetical protein